jgi:hypothetical protein
MDPHIPRIIPNMLRFYLEGEIVRRVFPVFFCVSAFVASASYAAADQADPEVVRAVAYTAE